MAVPKDKNHINILKALNMAEIPKITWGKSVASNATFKKLMELVRFELVLPVGVAMAWHYV